MIHSGLLLLEYSRMVESQLPVAKIRQSDLNLIQPIPKEDTFKRFLYCAFPFFVIVYVFRFPQALPEQIEELEQLISIAMTGVS